MDLLDVFGTFVFSVAGAFRAVKYELNLLGVLALSVVTGVGGGIARDTVLGLTPPAAFQNEVYLLVCILGGLIVFVAAPKIAKRWDWVLAADALGVGVFAAIGAAKAADRGLGWVGVCMMGALTATGGGVMRDVLVRRIPDVLKEDFYATAALVGGVALVVARKTGLGVEIQLGVAIAVATGLRILAMVYRFGAPKVKSLPASPTRLTDERKRGGPNPG